MASAEAGQRGRHPVLGARGADPRRLLRQASRGEVAEGVAGRQPGRKGRGGLERPAARGRGRAGGGGEGAAAPAERRGERRSRPRGRQRPRPGVSGRARGAVRVLLACAEVEVNPAQVNGATARFIATQRGHQAVVQPLLAHVAPVDPNQSEPEWCHAADHHRGEGPGGCGGAAPRPRLSTPTRLCRMAARRCSSPRCGAAKAPSASLLAPTRPGCAERAEPVRRTPHHAASNTRSTAAALALLEAKANPNAPTTTATRPSSSPARRQRAAARGAVAAGADVRRSTRPSSPSACSASARGALAAAGSASAAALQVPDTGEGPLAFRFRRRPKRRHRRRRAAAGA